MKTSARHHIAYDGQKGRHFGHTGHKFTFWAILKICQICLHMALNADIDCATQLRLGNFLKVVSLCFFKINVC